jgi:hypothetical protein
MHSPPGSTRLQDCSCNPNFYLADGSFECIVCPDAGGVSMVSPAGSTHISACKCPSLYYADTEDSLNTTCTQCPESTSSAEGSTSINSCICPPGLGVATNSYNRHVTSDQDTCDVEIRSMLYSWFMYVSSSRFLLTDTTWICCSSWRLSDDGDSCHESCAQLGLVCNAHSFESGMDQQILEVYTF